MTTLRTRQQLWPLAVLGLLVAVLLSTVPPGSSGAAPAALPHAQNGVTIEPVSHLGGWLGSLAMPPAGGDYVYLGEGTGFTVLDVSDKGNPHAAGSLVLTGGDVTDVAVVGDTAYFLNSDLRMVDISTPEQPTLLGSYSVGSWSTDLYVVHYPGAGSGQTIAYVSEYFSGLQILDVTNPVSPTLLGSYSTTPCQGVYVHNHTAYISRGTLSMLSVNVTDPAHPTLRGSYNPIGYVRDVEVVDSTAYLACDSSGLAIVNVTNPGSPSLLSSYDTPGTAWEVCVNGSTAYVADRAGGLQILNVGDPAHPAWIGTYSGLAGAARLAVSSSYAYVGAGAVGVHVVDVSTAATPTQVGAYERPSELHAADSSGPLTYLVAAAELWVADMSTPQQPAFLGRCALAGDTHSARIEVAGTLAYVTEGSYGLEIIDVADAANPTVLGHYSPPTGTVQLNDVFPTAAYAYILTDGGSERWLRILDVHDPASPAELAALPTPGDAHRLFVANGVAYVADGTAGLYLIDVSDPENPAELGQLAPPAGARTEAVHVVDDRAYVASNAGSTGQLQAVDVHDPANPTVVGTCPASGEIQDLTVHGDYAYLAASLNVVDLSNMTPVASYALPFCFQLNVYVVGDTVYVVLIRLSSFGGDIARVYLPPPAPTATPTHTSPAPPPPTEVPPCALDAKVKPDAAAGAGCSISPSGKVPCECAVDEFEFECSGGCTGWEFDKITPSEKVQCPEQGEEEVIAWYAPYLTLSGWKEQFLCASSEHQDVPVLSFNLRASEADSWQITQFTFTTEVTGTGDGSALTDITEVRLYWVQGGRDIGTGTYAGSPATVTFTGFGTIVIPAGGGQDFQLFHSFRQKLCGAPANAFETNVGHDGQPLTFSPGHPKGAAAGVVNLGCVRLQDWDKAYDTIQDPVDEAAAGMTCLVCPGTYEENVDVEQQVTIRSMEGAEKTEVKAGEADDHVFDMRADNITIDGFTIRGATACATAGIYLHGSVRVGGKMLNNQMIGNRVGAIVHSAQGTEIKGNRILNSTEAGLWLEASTESLIQDNSIFANSGDGIYMNYCQEATGKETKIAQNSLRDNAQSGVHLNECQGVTIEGNTTISDNQLHGVFVESSRGIKVINNAAVRNNHQNGVHVLNCLLQTGQPANEIAGNTIEEHRSGDGIHLEGSRGIKIGSTSSQNTIRYNGNGIAMLNSPGGDTPELKTQISGNMLQYNTQDGIYLKSSCGNSIPGENTVSTNDGHGIHLDTCQCSAADPVEITNNTIEGNKKNGIQLDSSYGNKIGDAGTGNTVRSNTMHGIGLSNCNCPEAQPNLIQANDVQQNTQSGIYIEKSTDNQIVGGNTVGPQNEHGIHLQEAIRITIEGNTINSNKQAGVRFMECNGANTIENNEIKSNVQGIHLRESGIEWGTPHDIIGNVIEGNAIGVYVDHSCNTRIWPYGGATPKRNQISANTQAGIALNMCECSNAWPNRIAANNIENNPGCGIKVVGSKWTEIEDDNQIKGNGDDGIFVAASTGNKIYQNTVGPNTGHGIYVVNCAAPPDEANEIYDNSITANGKDGIRMESSSGNRVGKDGQGKNRVQSNTGEGIHLLNCQCPSGSPNLIENNTVGPENKNGIYVESSSGNEVARNDVDDNNKDGIHLKSAENNRLASNHVRRNKGNGIYLKFSEQNKIDGNEVSQNGKEAGQSKGSGIYLYDSHYNYIPALDTMRNVITENGEHGIRLDSSNYNQFRGNRIAGNGGDGIHMEHCKHNRFTETHIIEYNQKNGVYMGYSLLNLFDGPIEQCTVITITDKLKTADVHYSAFIRNNEENGIFFHNTRNNWVYRYYIAGHDAGALLEGSVVDELQYNYFTLNSWGVRDKSSQGTKYINNVFFANTRPYTAIHLDNASPEIVGNTISGEEGDGIKCENGANPIIAENNIHDNKGAGVNNLDPSVTVSARDNWWGDASGPGGAGPGNGEEISGTIDFAGWRPISVTLTVLAREDPIVAARGAAVPTWLEFRSREIPSDTVAVTLTDALGWLVGATTFTTTLEGVGGSVAVTLTVPVDAAIGTVNDVTVTAASLTEPVTDTDSFRVIAALAADLVMVKRSEAPGLIEQPVTYTLVITNSGPDAASSVTVTDTLPAELAFLAATATQGTCAVQGVTVTCNLGAIAVGEQITITLVVRGNNSGMVLNGADVVASELDPDVRSNFATGYAIVQTPEPTIEGDMDGDCDVDIVDIMRVARRWGTAEGDANYDAYYDLDADGDIDIVDIMRVAIHWGESCD